MFKRWNLRKSRPQVFPGGPQRVFPFGHVSQRTTWPKCNRRPCWINRRGATIIGTCGLFSRARSAERRFMSARPVADSGLSEARLMTVSRFVDATRAGRKLSVLTAYDFLWAGLLDAAGVDAILVGDSLGMVVQGKPTTLPVTLD